MASAVISGNEALAPAKLPPKLPHKAPLGFVPPAVRAANPVKMSPLDPRPLWTEDAVIESPWKSAGFWTACILVVPIGTALKAAQRMFG